LGPQKILGWLRHCPDHASEVEHLSFRLFKENIGLRQRAFTVHNYSLLALMNYHPSWVQAEQDELSDKWL